MSAGKRLRCPACNIGFILPNQYTCTTCASKAPMFNHVRPPEMRGSIYTPWVSKVRDA